MTTLTINGKEYKIKYGYEATARCGVGNTVEELEALMEKGGNMDWADVDKILKLLPNILLAGLQKFHKDEFGYNYETGDGRQDALDKTFELVDDYFDENEGADFVDLFNLLQEEMLKNGFLARLLQSQAEEPKPKATKKATTRSTKKATS